MINDKGAMRLIRARLCVDRVNIPSPLLESCRILSIKPVVGVSNVFLYIFTIVTIADAHYTTFSGMPGRFKMFVHILGFRRYYQQQWFSTFFERSSEISILTF